MIELNNKLMNMDTVKLTRVCGATIAEERKAACFDHAFYPLAAASISRLLQEQGFDANHNDFIPASLDTEHCSGRQQNCKFPIVMDIQGEI